MFPFCMPFLWFFLHHSSSWGRREQKSSCHVTPQGELSVQYHQRERREIWRNLCCLSTDTHTKVTQQISSHRRVPDPPSLMTHLNKRPPRVSHPGSSASAVLHWTDSILKKYSEYYGMSSCILACSHSCDDQNWLQTLGDGNKWPLAESHSLRVRGDHGSGSQLCV